MSRRILITGGCGFIGHHLAEHIFKNTDDYVVVLDRLDTSGNLNRIGELIDAHEDWRKRFRFVYHDLRAEINGQIAADIGKITHIYHLAATSHVDRSIRYPMETVQDNVIGTCNLLNYAKGLDGLEYSQSFSSDEEFGDAINGESYKEWDRHKPRNPYCLHPETPVKLANGKTKHIKDISLNDELIGYDFNKLRMVSVRPTNIITDSVDSLIKITLSGCYGNLEIQCTPYHLWSIKHGDDIKEKSASDLVLGDLIPVVQSSNFLAFYEVVKTETVDYTGKVYDLTVPPYNNFLLDGIVGYIVTHNSASKSGANQLCHAYWATYGLPVVVTHCVNVIGERQHPEKFLPLCIKKILNGEEIKIHSYPGSKKSGSRFYVHARNVSAACLFLADNATFGDRYNLPGQVEMSNLEMAQFVAKVLDKPLKYELVDFHSNRPGHDLRYDICGDKLMRMGFNYPVSFEKSLEKTIKWTLDNERWLLE